MRIDNRLVRMYVTCIAIYLNSYWGAKSQIKIEFETIRQIKYIEDDGVCCFFRIFAAF